VTAQANCVVFIGEDPQHGAEDTGPPQITRIGRRRLTRSETKLAETGTDLRRAPGTCTAPRSRAASTAAASPALLALPAAIHHAIAAAYADSIRTMFLIAVPIGRVAFVAAPFIPASSCAPRPPCTTQSRAHQPR
jgi:hypothetical protein